MAKPLTRSPPKDKLKAVRRTRLIINQSYHLYNRGVDKRTIFPNPSYYSRFLSTLKHSLNFDYPFSSLINRLKKATTAGKKASILKEMEGYRINPPLEIVSFCLMPNHYHLAVKQLTEEGISKFVHKIATGYTRYFNIRNERSGRLFETTYKAKLIESEEQLIHLSRYHHLNPQKIAHTKEELTNYPWSSFRYYLNDRTHSFINSEPVLSHFTGPQEYVDFVFAQVDEFETFRIGNLAIDDDLGWFEGFRKLEEDRQSDLKEKYLKATISF